MRHFGKFLWLLPLALLAASSLASRPSAATTPNPRTTPRSFLARAPTSRGVLSGDHFYTIVGSAVMDVDLKQRQATERASLTECYDYIPTAPFLDVADGKAVVASEKGTSAAPAINVIDLSNGKVLHAVKYKGEVHGLGFVGDDRVFVIGATDVVVLNVAGGDVVQTIPVVKPDRTQRAGMAALSTYQKVGKLLYLADNAAMRVQVVDLEAGKVVDELRAGYDWFGGLQVVGDKAFVRSINLSYGINNPQFGWFDLKTKKLLLP